MRHVSNPWGKAGGTPATSGASLKDIQHREEQMKQKEPKKQDNVSKSPNLTWNLTSHNQPAPSFAQIVQEQSHTNPASDTGSKKSQPQQRQSPGTWKSPENTEKVSLRDIQAQESQDEGVRKDNNTATQSSKSSPNRGKKSSKPPETVHGPWGKVPAAPKNSLRDIQQQETNKGQSEKKNSPDTTKSNDDDSFWGLPTETKSTSDNDFPSLNSRASSSTSSQNSSDSATKSGGGGSGRGRGGTGESRKQPRNTGGGGGGGGTGSGKRGGKKFSKKVDPSMFFSVKPHPPTVLPED